MVTNAAPQQQAPHVEPWLEARIVGKVDLVWLDADDQVRAHHDVHLDGDEFESRTFVKGWRLSLPRPERPERRRR
jgi:hypothetical protein